MSDVRDALRKVDFLGYDGPNRALRGIGDQMSTAGAPWTEAWDVPELSAEEIASIKTRGAGCPNLRHTFASVALPAGL
jgi:hypothetical protein